MLKCKKTKQNKLTKKTLTHYHDSSLQTCSHTWLYYCDRYLTYQIVLSYHNVLVGLYSATHFQHSIQIQQLKNCISLTTGKSFFWFTTLWTIGKSFFWFTTLWTIRKSFFWFMTLWTIRKSFFWFMTLWTIGKSFFWFMTLWCGQAAKIQLPTYLLFKFPPLRQHTSIHAEKR